MNNHPSPPRLFYKLARAQNQIRKTADRLCLDALGVTSTQLGALYWLARHPDAHYTQLAEALGQNRSAITGLVSRMTALSLVTQRTSPDDRRALLLSLTPEGRAVVSRARPLQERFNTAMTNGFSVEEQSIIARFLDHLISEEFL